MPARCLFTRVIFHQRADASYVINKSSRSPQVSGEGGFSAPSAAGAPAKTGGEEGRVTRTQAPCGVGAAPQAHVGRGLSSRTLAPRPAPAGIFHPSSPHPHPRLEETGPAVRGSCKVAPLGVMQVRRVGLQGPSL